jgi:excisionase family DNA binding protein
MTSDSQNVSLTVSVTEAARLPGIGRSLAYELVARGDLPSVRLGRRVLIPGHALVRPMLTGDESDELVAGIPLDVAAGTHTNDA